MNEAPARLWIDPEYIEDENDCVSRVKIMHRDVEYIRADLVDELVKALNTANDLMKLNIAVQEHIQSVLDAMKEEK